MNHPHEQQAAAMARAGELPDGEQLRECINSGQVSAAQVVAHAENGDVNFKPLCKRCEDIGECTPRGLESCQIPREVTTGWPAGLLQDDSKGLSKALSRDPNARAHVRDAAIEIERFEPDHDSNGSYMAFYLDGDYVRHSDHIEAIAAERAEVVRLREAL